MRPILASRTFLLGSAIVLLFAGGCSQGEGGRCQIDSDCASGLVCRNPETGNGTCGPNNAGELADAAAKEDVSLPPSLEVQSQADTAPAADDAELGPGLDGGALDGGSVDERAIDSL